MNYTPKNHTVNIDASIVFQKNWSAINTICDACNGSGYVEGRSCSWCGDGQSGNKGNGKKYRYIINEGSSRSSKTFSLIDLYDLYARTTRHKRLTVWRDTRTDCIKTVLNDAIRHLSVTKRWLQGHRFSETKSILTYTTNSTFEIHGTDDENTVMGLNQHVAWLNEPYKISKTIADQIDQRTEDFLIIDWNPKLAHWVEDLKKDKRAIVIHSTFKDNPWCPANQRNKILSYQPVKLCQLVVEKILTEREANEYDITGNPLNFSEKQLNELSRCKENEYKRSASEYNWQVYGLGMKAEKPNRIFRFEEISIEQYQNLDVPIYYYSDWGAVDPWAVGEAKYYDGGLYLRELNYDSENSLRMKLTPTELHQIGVEDEGIVSWMFNKLSIDNTRSIVCDSNRPMKIIALRNAGYDYAIAAPKGTGSIVDGIDLVNNLRVYYTSDSVNIKHEQENYSRKVDRYGIVLEEPEDFDNHHMDGARYIATFLQAEGIIRKV